MMVAAIAIGVAVYTVKFPPPPPDVTYIVVIKKMTDEPIEEDARFEVLCVRGDESDAIEQEDDNFFYGGGTQIKGNLRDVREAAAEFLEKRKQYNPRFAHITGYRGVIKRRTP